jgi:hypothetical protein
LLGGHAIGVLKEKMKFILESKKSKDEIIQIMKENTSPARSAFYRNYDEFFNGKILEDSFKLQRNINYRNSFLPVLIGEINENDSCTRITIRTRMNFFVIVFLLIWFGGVSLGCLITPFADFEIQFKFIPYLMLFAGILITVLPYNYETKKAKEKLEELLK